MNAIFTSTLVFGALCLGACAQTSKEKKDISVEKEVRVNDETGETTIKITTTENGKTTVKEMHGEEAEKHLAEHGHSAKGDGKQMRKVMVIDHDGKSEEIDVEEILAEAGVSIDIDIDGEDTHGIIIKKVKKGDDGEVEEIIEVEGMDDIKELLEKMDIDIDIDGDHVKKKVVVIDKNEESMSEDAKVIKDKEVYEGKDAEKILKDMDIEIDGKPKKVTVKKTVIIEE